MKGPRLLLYVCLGMLAFGHVWAVDGDDTARAATRRSVPGATNQTPPGRAAPTTPKVTATARTTTTTVRTAATESRATTNTVVPRTVSARTTATTQQNVQKRPSTTAARRATTAARTATTARSATAPRKTSRKSTARATVAESGTVSTNYTKCRTIFYECMDEFCAVKDANLRRCACSARSNEFDNVKKQLENVENKMLDFNQRLLLVNMDAEDVNAINTATAGEDAFYSTRDTTESKRALDDIAKKLNAKFGESTDSGGGGLGAISLTLNVDAAFDTVDSFMGIDTTSKSGVALYNAAYPVCHDIAREVCTDEEISLAQSGYQMQIEQDCNTVKKAYQSKVDQARTKVFESGALLDMSRLDAYQTRNSDDMLTCKRKMLEMLTDTTVCGAKMEKCLDMTGRYIDPTTGAALLSVNLADLDTMITRPGPNQTWTSVNSSGKFITFLNDRKKFLGAAMGNCENIADTVWDAFIEDALSQIKLAQTAKLEEIRQACTTLTTECLNTANETIENFDARALSIFGIMADRTANTMCADVRTSCANLLGATGDTSWETGMGEISTDMTYESILSSCTQVGQNCIIQACKSISGNFGLCDDIEFSANRHAILERTACWPDVVNCVTSAGGDAITLIMQRLGKSGTGNHKYAFYKEIYGDANIQPIDDICATKCTATNLDTDCATCRIAESIWGNCEALPSVTLGNNEDEGHNRIHKPANNQSTLLSWFASNTQTANSEQNCVNTRCTGDNTYINSNGQTVCLPEGAATGNVTTDGMYCPVPPNFQMETVIDNGEQQTNCCFDNSMYWHHTFIGGTSHNACCETGNTRTFDGQNVCLPAGENGTQLARRTDNSERIICIGTIGAPSPTSATNGFPNGNTILCNGTFIRVTSDNMYSQEYNTSGTPGTGTKYAPKMGYYNTGHDTFIETGNPGNWFIRYETQ